ncbi:ribulose 1,5-bisphosphate carboxylase [Pseudorhodoplanes sinuspersici]|uniref:Ribulose 1,5-bisphosphate carboxylase n=2 Tax=Pseudorhodoplanes sinuspersici TaxID=1235591 RepID=A0A1W6ZZJ4_9HYPH|nr:ribulose 1,5-bisphosphate carboxylase [Pseudorhodoplanes sinuspersici]
MPLTAISDRAVLDNIVGRVEAIKAVDEGLFEVSVGLSVATSGMEAGQLFNMLFGNTSLHPEVMLKDAVFPDELLAAFGGPRHGISGLRQRVGAGIRALTCSALKPQGSSARELAELARQLARGGLDFIKDDHGLADQVYSPFAERVPRIAEAVREARANDGGRTCYLPSLSGNLDQLRRQVELARAEGIDAVLIAPMVTGVSAFHTIVRENPDFAFMTHPSMAGAARIAPPLLLGKLFRLLGADATVFPNYGGRFGYSQDECRELAKAALARWSKFPATVPVPAGGMTLDRVAEMLEFYGLDVIVLVGGGLLSAGTRITQETAAFVDAVVRHQTA